MQRVGGLRKGEELQSSKVSHIKQKINKVFLSFYSVVGLTLHPIVIMLFGKSMFHTRLVVLEVWLV